LKCVALGARANFNNCVAEQDYFPTEADLVSTGPAQDFLRARAMAATRKRFGKKVFVRAVVEASNFCRENCGYCGMRRDNRALTRYRAKYEQIAEFLIRHRPASVTDVNIQTGEDPVAVREVVLPLIETLRRETSLGISVCLGTLSSELYDELQNAGASIFIMKFESGDAAQYEQLEAPGTLAERLRHIRLLAKNNWNVSSGFITGLPGQTTRELLKNFELARELPLHGCSVSPFIPGEATPLAKYPTANADWTFNCVSALRLMRPDWIIPAVSAFNLAAQDGYRRGLCAGANLVTMNLTPTDVRDDYVIYKRDRFIMTEERVLNVAMASTASPQKNFRKRFNRKGSVLFPAPRKLDPTGANHVVVTGAGIVTALGTGWKINTDGFRAGRTAFRPVTLFDVSRQRSKIAAEMDLPAGLPATKLSPNTARRLNRASKMLLHAAHEAWTQSGWQTQENLPVVLGTTSGEMFFGEKYLQQALKSPFARKRQPTRVVHYQLQQQGLDLCNAFDFCGPVTTISNACASGANAIGHAFEMLRSGRAEKVLTGGYDALCQLTFAGFDSLQALSPMPCRPFDAARDGLTLGEGAAVLTLETLEHARKRNSEILGEIIGYGATTDTHHLTQPHPDGNAAFAAMTAACACAKISPKQVDYVNAHGTATPQNDATESAAINRWAGERAKTLPVSSTKSSVGHLLGGAGAVEAVVCLMTLRGQWLPPQTSLNKIDPACHFQIVREPADKKIEIALSNSFGFGGANASLIFRRWP